MKISEIIIHLDRIREGLLPESESAKAISEASDIIYDYDRAADVSARLSEKHEKPKNAIRRGNGDFATWQCPDCQNFIGYGNQYCHWCGRKLGWDHRISKRKERK